jgi:putative ABC transport system permease protein
MLPDLRYAFRTLRREPLFALVAILTLALGIGANSAIFAVVDAVLLRPLPYRDADRLLTIHERIPRVSSFAMNVPAPDVLEFQRTNVAFESVAGFTSTTADLTGAGQPERLSALRSTPELFGVLGATPRIGRTFTAAEDHPRSDVAVISDRLWRSRFGGDPSVVGRVVQLDRRPVTIIGVMPRGFEFPLPGVSYFKPADLWIPMGFTPRELAANTDEFNYGVVARIKPGLNRAQALGDVQRMVSIVFARYPAEAKGLLTVEGSIAPLAEDIVKGPRDLLWLLMGAVGFVLLIACANVANLLLGRAARREREMAIRSSMGASRVRLLRQLLTESLVLAVAGAVAGIALAFGLLQFIATLIPESVPRAGQIALDWRVAGFTLAVSMVAAVIFGIVPAFAAARAQEGSQLKDAARGATAGSRRARLRGLLVASEVALSLALLVGAGLLVRTFAALNRVNPGFEVEHLLSASLALPSSTYSRPAQIRSFYQRAVDEARTIPGVRAAGATTAPFLDTYWTHLFAIRSAREGSLSTRPSCAAALVLGDYFQAAGIPLVRGRYFDDRDRDGAPRTLVINEAFARTYFLGQDPIGQQVRWGVDLPGNDSPWLTIVGVVGDVKNLGLAKAAMPQTYEHYPQFENAGITFIGNSMTIAVKSAGDPAALGGSLRAAVAKIDSQLPVTDLQTAHVLIGKSLAGVSFQTALIGSFAGLALLLAGIGIYGVVSYAVSQRTQEIGVRMALGATRGNVLGLVLRQGMLYVAAGVVVGLGAAFALKKFIASFLFGVTAADVLTFSAAAVALIAIALLANFAPARRAASVDPAVALRHE